MWYSIYTARPKLSNHVNVMCTISKDVNFRDHSNYMTMVPRCMSVSKILAYIDITDSGLKMIQYSWKHMYYAFSLDPIFSYLSRIHVDVNLFVTCDYCL